MDIICLTAFFARRRVVGFRLIFTSKIIGNDEILILEYNDIRNTIIIVVVYWPEIYRFRLSIVGSPPNIVKIKRSIPRYGIGHYEARWKRCLSHIVEVTVIVGGGTFIKALNSLTGAQQPILTGKILQIIHSLFFYHVQIYVNLNTLIGV